jgi:hypothetical protein
VESRSKRRVSKGISCFVLAFTKARTPSLPRFPLFLHHFPQRPIDPGLVAAPRFPEPGEHIRIQTQRNRPLGRSIPLRQICQRDKVRLRLLRRTQADRLLPPNCLPTLLNSCRSFHLGSIIHTYPYPHYCRHKMFPPEHWAQAVLIFRSQHSSCRALGVPLGKARDYSLALLRHKTAPPRFVTPVSHVCDPMEWGRVHDPPGGAILYSSASLAASLNISTNIFRVSLPVCVFWFDG